MGFCLIGFWVYAIAVLAEQVLVAVSPRLLEQLQNSADIKHQQLLPMVRSIRRPLTALMLVRVLMLVLVTIYSIILIRDAGWYKALIMEWPEAAQLTSIFFPVLSSILISTAAWTLHKLSFSRLIERQHTLLLERLQWFIRFWLMLFSPFIAKNVVSSTGSAAKQTLVGTTTQDDEKQELELLKSIVKFGDVTVRQVMQQRSAITAISTAYQYDEVLDIIRKNEYSRMPVFEEDLDNITGILYVKDLIPHLQKGSDFEWQPLQRTQIMTVPEAKPGVELLQEFKSLKTHMAIVIDEFGGTAGIVTLEDILEEITGEIRDEFDEENNQPFRIINETTYLFEGQISLTEVCRILGLPLETFDEIKGNADTLAGLVLEIVEEIPKTGTTFAWETFQFTITSADTRRIRQIKVQYNV